MFGTMFLKEIHEVLITWKFVFSSLLLIILIPLGMFVTLDDYQQRLTDYRTAEQLYQQRSEDRVHSTFKAEGYRPPSPLSVFAVGLDPFLPNKAVTSRSGNVFSDKSTVEGIVVVSNSSSLNNPLSVFFGKMDYLFNVGFVLSIFAFVFTFAGITAEKEQGTLKLIMSNTVSRWSLLLAKLTGNFIVFVLPFLAAFLVGIILLSISTVFPLTESDIFGAIVVMLVVSVLFLLCMFTFGIMISASSRYSISAIIVLLFIWVLMALVIPKLSPMVAQKIHPVDSEEVVMQQIRTVRMDIENELSDRENELFAETLGRYGLTLEQYFANDTTEQREQLEADYEELIAPVREEYSIRLAEETTRLQRDYANERAAQQGIAIRLSRISPVSCFMYILAAIASTGPQEADNFTRQAELFQEQVTRDVYDQFTYMRFGTGGRMNVGFSTKEGVELDGLSVPHMTGYRHASLGEAFANTWVDLLLLAMYTILFFAGAFVKFLKYDVR